MFKSLKNKLKGWFKKTEEPEEALEKEEKEVLEKPKKESKKSFFKKTLSQEKFDDLFQELEMILLQNNVALKVIDKIKQDLQEKLVGNELSKINLKQELKDTLSQILIEKDFLSEVKQRIKEKKPLVIVFFGINGCGKTTTIAKIANLLKRSNITSCFAAADTFRAASIEQLQQHADSLNIPLIKKSYGSDPASVGFDAINFAKKRGIDVVLIDTAGRMQNQDSLMKEMQKIVRVTAPDLKIFVAESITGNDAIEQTNTFNEAVGIDGIILSKADVDERGGTALSISYLTQKPIFFVGTGQSYDDLKNFQKEEFLQNLLE